MSSSLQVGASLRSPLSMRGRRAADSTTTSTTTSTTSSTSVDFAVVGGWLQPLLPTGNSRKTTEQEKDKLLAPAAVGASLRSPLPIRGRRTADSTTTSTTSTTTSTTTATVDFAVDGGMTSSRCRR